MTDQPTISLAQWCAYLPHFIKVRHVETGSEANLTIQNLEAILSSSFWAAGLKPLLRPMNEDVNVSAVMQVYRNAYNRKDLVWNSKLKLFVSQIDGARLSIHSIPHDVVEAFLAAHYDIYDLIPQDLALPIE